MAMTFAAASTEYLNAASEFAALRTTASLSFWMRTTQVGSDTFYEAPGITGIEEAGAGDDIFWGWIDNNAGSSRINIRKGDTTDAIGPTINTGALFHVVLTWNSSTGLVQIYINGVFYASVTSGTVDVGNTFSRIASIDDTGGTPTYFDGTLDDVRIYNRVLTANEIAALYAQRGGDSLYYGLVHKYRMDEGAPGASASGSGSVTDVTGANNCTPTNTPTYAEADVMRRRRRAA
jgi:MSHA biogenesis protein MshQ